MLAAAIGYGTGGGLIMMLAGLFIKPMRDALGWSTAAVTFVPVTLLVWAICYPVAGAVIDRFGSRFTAIIGNAALATCFLLLAILPISQFSLYAIAAAMGVCASITAVPTYTRGVASWFRSGVGLAFGIALSGTVLISVFATPITGFIIADHGWRAGFLTIAGIILLVGFPFILFLYRERDRAGSSAEEVAADQSGVPALAALRDGRFWCYVLSFTFACIPLGGTLTHLQPLLAEKNFPLDTALSLGVLYAIAMSLGKVCGGMLLDRFWPFGVAAVLTLIAAIGSVGLATVDFGAAYLLVALLVMSIGLAQGAEADFVAFFILRSFGMRAFSTVVGMLATVVTLGLTIGAWFYGAIFDLQGNYELSLYLGAGFLTVASLFALLAGALDRRRSSVTDSPSSTF